MLQAGDQFNKYHLVKQLGNGGFAEVWMAQDQLKQQEVAIKILNIQIPTESDQTTFLNEAHHLTRLDHPNIIKLRDCGIKNNTPYLVLDYAPNGTLRDRHPQGSILSLQSVLQYMQQIVKGLQYAHDNRIIHRDIKPENMLLDKQNKLLLSDFGIALLGQTLPYPKTQNVMGTTGYMAPEQLDGHPALASDQYSLAVVITEWLCGSRLFKGKPIEIRIQQSTPAIILKKKITNIPPALEQVLLKALSEKVEDRYKRVQEFADAFAHAINDPYSPLHLTTQTPPSSALQPQPEPAPSAVIDVKSPSPASNTPEAVPAKQAPSPHPSSSHTPSPFNQANITPVKHTPFSAEAGNISAGKIPFQPPHQSSLQGQLHLPNSSNNRTNQTPGPSPFYQSPVPANSNPGRSLHSFATIPTPQAGSSPFVPYNPNTPSPSSQNYTQSHWLAAWIDTRFLRRTKNRFFLYGGSVIDFVFSVSISILLTPSNATDIGWYVWFFGLTGALIVRALCAASSNRPIALFFATCLTVYWFMGSWALAMQIHSRTFLEPAPPLILALITGAISLLLHINYVLKNKR